MTDLRVRYKIDKRWSAALGIEDGIFAKHGLDVTLQIVPTPSVVPPMLVSESVQIAYATPPNILLANEGGLDLVAIAGGARLIKNNAKISFVTRSGVTIDRSALSAVSMT